jgi:hypothetical protein
MYIVCSVYIAPIEIFSPKQVKGTSAKTWLIGLNTNTVKEFYEFDSEQNAGAFAAGLTLSHRPIWGQVLR